MWTSSYKLRMCWKSIGGHYHSFLRYVLVTLNKSDMILTLPHSSWNFRSFGCETQAKGRSHSCRSQHTIMPPSFFPLWPPLLVGAATTAHVLCSGCTWTGCLPLCVICLGTRFSVLYSCLTTGAFIPSGLPPSQLYFKPFPKFPLIRPCLHETSTFGI